jgi:hypothetical protein
LHALGLTTEDTENTTEREGEREIEQPKVDPKGTQAARVAARESAEGSPHRGEMSGSERVNIAERERASQRWRVSFFIGWVCLGTMSGWERIARVGEIGR